jgi:hypothetical protein
MAQKLWGGDPLLRKSLNEDPRRFRAPALVFHIIERLYRIRMRVADELQNCLQLRIQKKKRTNK